MESRTVLFLRALVFCLFALSLASAPGALARAPLQETRELISVDAGSDQTADESQAVNFSGSYEDDNIYDGHLVEWDFGDGATDSSGSLTPSHTYSNDGVYEVTLSVTNLSTGTNLEDTLTVTVENVPPEVDAGADQTITAGETFNSSGSFTDPGEDEWTASVDYGNGSGEQPMTLNDDKTFTLSHTYTSVDTYIVTVTVSDGVASGSDTATVTVVEPENTMPTVDAGSDASLNEGGTFSSSGSFGDPDDDEWTATVDYGDGSGVQPLTLNEDKTFDLNHTYTNDGVYTVTVSVSDGEASDDGTASITVSNVAPTVSAGPDATIGEGSAFNSSGSFTDPGADPWTATVDYGDGSGVQALALNGDKTFSLNHTYAEAGSYTVTVTVSDDDTSGSDTAAVTVQATPNTPPSVEAGSGASLNEGGVFSSSGSFSDPDEDDSWTATVNYGDGSGVQDLSLEDDKTFNLTHTYTDDGSYIVTVTVSDGEASDEDTATVTVSNVAPTVSAGPDGTIGEGSAFIRSGSFTDPGDDAWTGTVDYGDGSGVQDLTLNSDKTFSLNHTYADNGTYTITVTVSDGAESGSDTVTVTVTNVTPTVSAGPDASIEEGSTFASSGSFSDLGDEDWSATVSYGDGSGVQDLPLNADKTFSLNHVYVDDGVYTVTVTVNDGTASGSDQASVTVTNANPVAEAGGPYTLNEGNTMKLNGTATDKGANDINTLTFDWDLDGDGQYDDDNVTGKKPTFNAFAVDGPATLTVSLRVTDKDGGIGYDSATITVNNVPPVAMNDTYQVSEDGQIAIAAPGVLGNDSDPGPELLTAELVSGPANGELLLNSDGSFTYTPDANFVGTDAFTYLANDGTADSAVATATIAVGGTNDSPTDLALDNTSIAEGQPAGTPVGVFTTIDADSGDTHTYSLVSGDGDEGNSSFKIAGNTLQTAVVLDFETQSSYSILVQTKDAQGATFQKSFTITVTNTNEPPVALSDPYEVDSGMTLTVPAEDGVLSNDSDPDGDSLTAVLVAGTANGELVLNGDGSFTYTPDDSFSTGEDTFTYYAQDGEGLQSDTVEVVINVRDADSPQVFWEAPVEDGQTLMVGNEIILLQAGAFDDVEVDYVYFYRWDAVQEVYVDIAVVEDPPYEVEFNTSVLNFGFNQIFIKAYDDAGNESGRKWIWLYKLPPSQWLYLPLVGGEP